MENTQNQNSIQNQNPSAKQKPGPGVLVASVGAFLVVMMFIFGGCNFGKSGSDLTVQEYERTNRDMIHQAGVTAGVNAIMGK